MTFRLSVKRKISTTEFSEVQPLSTLNQDGSFEAQNLGFARRDANAYVREWVESSGMKMRTQKDWVKNPKTKFLEKQVMVQNGEKPETYIFILEN